MPYLMVGLVVVGASLALGMSVHNEKMRRYILLAAAGIFVLAGWFISGEFKMGLGQGIFLFIILVMTPFSLGTRIGRRVGKGQS